MNENQQPNTSDVSRELFRHTVATLAYRGGKTLRNTPAGFGDFQAGGGVRTPVQILAHLGDLLDWASSIAAGQEKWNNSGPLPWEQEVERFFAALKKFDDLLASSAPLQAPLEKLFQGPVADALTHVGQIGMLRRLAGSAVNGENYYIASIEAGRVGSEQTQPKFEF
jgi:hypothetical protein